jgi:CelD/BcsL family acetyltransferase involved in cellulose biosynthesis
MSIASSPTRVQPARVTTPSLPAREGSVRAEPVSELAALEALRPEWEQLWARVPNATPFQSPAWLLPWWRHVGEGRLACVAVWSADSELVGFAALYVYDNGATGLRHLFPLGIATTDVLDVLVLPGWEPEVLRAMCAQLAESAAAFDLLEFPQLRRGSVLLEARPPADWQRSIGSDEPHPVLDLRDEGTMPKRMRDNLRHARSRADGAGHWRCETAAEARQVGEFLDALARLHAQRWSERGESGVLNERVLAAHRETAPRLLEAGLLRLHALRLDEEIVAALYCVADRGDVGDRRCYYYIGGFDPAHAAISPGTLLVGHAIEQARAEGAVAFDFLRGQEPYKYRWGAVDEEMFALRWTATRGREAAS